MITVNMMVFNEAEYLEPCIEALRAFCDRLVIMDLGSTDGSREVLSRLWQEDTTLILHDQRSTPGYAERRNLMLNDSPPGWILKWDPDELPTRRMQEELPSFLARPSFIDAYNVRIYHLVQNGSTFSAAYPEAHVRLFKNEPHIRWHGHVHEAIGGYRTGGSLPGDIAVVHLSFLDLDRLRRKGEHYATIPGSGFSYWEDLVYRDYKPAPLPAEIDYHADPKWLDRLCRRSCERRGVTRLRGQAETVLGMNAHVLTGHDRLDFVASNYKKGDILDVGCGEGGFSVWLQRQGNNVTMTDILPVPIPCPGVRFRQEDVLHLDDRDQYDTVLLMELIEHLEWPRVAIGNCYRALKPGGRLLITTPHVPDWDDEHIWRFDYDGVYWLLSEFGSIRTLIWTDDIFVYAVVGK